MKRTATLVLTTLAFLPTLGTAQRREAPSPRQAPQSVPRMDRPSVSAPRSVPAPAPAPRPSPAPVVRDFTPQRSQPAPTRTFEPPSRSAPSPAPTRDNRFVPTPRNDVIRQPPVRVDPTPSFQPAPRTRGESSGLDSRGNYTRPTPRGFEPLPRPNSTPERGTPVNPSVRSDDVIAAPRPRIRMEGSTRPRGETPSTPSAPSPRDVYRERTPLSAPGRETPRQGASSTFRDSLADRYRNQLQRDLEQRDGGRSATPTPPRIAAPPRDRGASSAPRDVVRPGTPRNHGSNGATNVGSHHYPTPNAALTNAAAPRAVRDQPLKLVPHTPTAPRPGPRANGGPVLTQPRWGSTHYFPGGSTAYFNGASHWRGHSFSLSFAFGYAPTWCSWGLYSYPFYYSCAWPRWYWCYRSSFSFCWNSYYPWWNTCWWWPSGYYQPSAYLSYYGGSGYGYGGYYGYNSGYASGYDEGYDAGYSEGRYYRTAYRGGSVEVVDDSPAGTPAGEGEHISAGSEVTPTPEVIRGKTVTPTERLVSMGDFYFREERFAEATESYLKALALAPEDASLHFVLADALFATGDYHYAAFMIGKALRLQPSLATSTADKRKFYPHPETFDSQLETLRHYLAEKPYDAAAHLVLGYNLKFSGDAAGSETAFKRALEIEPTNEAATLLLEALKKPKVV